MITVNGKTVYLNWTGMSGSGGSGDGDGNSSDTQIKNIVVNNTEKEITIIYQNNTTEIVSFKDIKLDNVEIDEDDLVTFTNSDGSTLTLDLSRFTKESDIVDALNDYYTKAEVDSFLNNKANTNHTHTADEVNETPTRKWFSNSDKDKLDNIEQNATADMTPIEIKSAYESNSNTNVYDNTAKTKVDRLTLTQPINLDNLKQEIEANTDKQHDSVTVTQTDDVNVSINNQDLTITAKPELIGGKPLDDTLSGSEEVLLNDSGTLKKTTVQTIVDMADNGGVDVSGKEDKSNKVTTIRDDTSATDVNYPSEKAVRAELDSLTSNIDTHKNKTNNPHNVTKDQIGLSNVDNTSDLDKPISTDTQNALNTKEDISNKKISISPIGSASDSKYVSEKAIRTALDGKANSSHNHTADDVTETDDKKWFTPTERTKLSNIEENATGDMTASEIKQAYESNNNTNAYTDDDKTTVNHLTVTNDIDLDALKQEVTTNTTKRHDPVTVSDTDDIDMQISGQEVSGNIKPTVIANKLAKSVLDNTDEFLINDGGILKKTTVEDIINKVPSIDNSGKEDKSNKTTTIRGSDTADDIKYPTEKAVRTELDSQSDSLNNHKNDTNNPHSVTKDQIGLDNVDNTSDADKPISTATQTALDGKEDKANKGQANGYASLDANGKVPSSQLPSYVDDVEEYATKNNFPTNGEASKIYISKNDNTTWRWSGSGYTNLGSGDGELVLGETSSTAYRGDRGKIAYDHSQLTSGNPHNVTKTNIGLDKVDNTSDSEKPISDATQLALDDRELLSNKTSSIRNSVNADDTKYPTEKAVRTELDNKSDSNHTHNSSDINLVNGDNWFKDTDKTKLNGIEDGATADMTPSELKQAYESNADTNAFTDNDKVKVNHITITNDVNLDTLSQDVTANTNKRHDEVTVTDSDDIDFTLTNQDITATIKASSIGSKALKSNVAKTEELLLNDNGVLKKTTIQSIIDAVPSSDTSGKEDKANKTTTIRDSVSADDVKYPTEKAVRTELDTIQNDLNSHKTASNPHNINKDTIGLSNVDNTSDTDKPVSTATQNALDNKSDVGHSHNLSEISIDINKDWNQKEISNLKKLTIGDGTNETTLTTNLIHLANQNDLFRINLYDNEPRVDLNFRDKADPTQTLGKTLSIEQDGWRIGSNHIVTWDSTNNDFLNSNGVSLGVNTITNDEKTKLGYITIVNDIDLDTVKQDTDLNTAKRHDALTKQDTDDIKHTLNGQQLSSEALPTLIGNKTLKSTLNASDEVLIKDSADSSLKKTTVQDIANLSAVDISGKEDKANKVTTVRNSTNATDINYPSEKAVRIELDNLDSTITSHVNSTANPHNVDKNDVGLGNVDNTSDANKPISTATQNALDDKADNIHSHVLSDVFIDTDKDWQNKRIINTKSIETKSSSDNNVKSLLVDNALYLYNQNNVLLVNMYDTSSNAEIVLKDTTQSPAVNIGSKLKFTSTRTELQDKPIVTYENNKLYINPNTEIDIHKSIYGKEYLNISTYCYAIFIGTNDKWGETKNTPYISVLPTADPNTVFIDTVGLQQQIAYGDIIRTQEDIESTVSDGSGGYKTYKSYSIKVPETGLYEISMYTELSFKDGDFNDWIGIGLSDTKPVHDSDFSLSQRVSGFNRKQDRLDAGPLFNTIQGVKIFTLDSTKTYYPCIQSLTSAYLQNWGIIIRRIKN